MLTNQISRQVTASLGSIIISLRISLRAELKTLDRPAGVLILTLLLLLSQAVPRRLRHVRHVGGCAQYTRDANAGEHRGAVGHVAGGGRPDAGARQAVREVPRRLGARGRALQVLLIYDNITFHSYDYC